MLDNDSLTYGRPKVAAKQAERALLTLERSQKLDLTIHLLTNLQQPLVVCGPQGIGKTTLLRTLIEMHGDAWHICLQQGSAALSFEGIVSELSRFLSLSGSGVGFDLSALRAFCNKQKVVLIIDDADNLVPGLIGELTAFAESLTSFRLVLAMSDEAFQDRSAVDRALDDCHFIELPPLSQKQCKDYLQNLSAQPGAVLSYNAISDAMVEALYRETQGIPGKILAELPKFGQFDSRQQRKLGLGLGVLAVCAMAGFGVYSLYVDDLTVPESVTTSATTPEPEVVAPAVPVPDAGVQSESTQVIELPPAPDIATLPAAGEPAKTETMVSEPAVTAIAPTMPANPPAAEARNEPPKTTPPVPAIEEKMADTPPPAIKTEEAAGVVGEKPAVEVAASEDETKLVEPHAASTTPSLKPPVEQSAHGNGNGDDIAWIMAQPANNVTLQVMVLSSKDSVKRFIKKYPDYADNIKSYPIGKDGSEKYVIIYGSFLSAEDAMKRKSTMPDDFNRGLEKRFKFVQREARR